jgi:hypothetical protein
LPSSVQSNSAQFSPVPRVSPARQIRALVQFCSIQSSSVEFSRVQSSSVEFSLVQSSSALQFRASDQFSPVQPSSVQFSPVQSSSARQSRASDPRDSSVQFSSVQSSSVHFSQLSPVPRVSSARQSRSIQLSPLQSAQYSSACQFRASVQSSSVQFRASVHFSSVQTCSVHFSKFSPFPRVSSARQFSSVQSSSGQLSPLQSAQSSSARQFRTPV